MPKFAFYSCVDQFSIWLIKKSASMSPAGLRHRLQEEWLADFSTQPNPIRRLFFAFGILQATWDISIENSKNKRTEQKHQKMSVPIDNNSNAEIRAKYYKKSEYVRPHKRSMTIKGYYRLSNKQDINKKFRKYENQKSDQENYVINVLALFMSALVVAFVLV